MRFAGRCHASSKVFFTFCFVGPAFAAAIQLLLLNFFLLTIYLQSPAIPAPSGSGLAHLLVIGVVELLGVIEAIWIILFGFPAGIVVAAAATLSYLTVKRVSVIAVVAAVGAAAFFEQILARGSYLDYLAVYDVRGHVLDGQDRNETSAAFLLWVLHVLPALTCWWLVKDMRSETGMDRKGETQE
jgi:hypothetical protein